MLGEVHEAEQWAQKAQLFGSPRANRLLQTIAWERRVTKDMEGAENDCVRIRYHPRHRRMAQILLEVPCERLWSLRRALDCCPHNFKPAVILLTDEEFPAGRGLPAGSVFSRIFISVPASASELVESFKAEYAGALMVWMSAGQSPSWLLDGLANAFTRINVPFTWRVALYHRVKEGTLPPLGAFGRLTRESEKSMDESARAGPLTDLEMAVLSNQLAAERLLARAESKPIGHFLHRVTQVGVDPAFQETFGTTLKEFEESWLKLLQTTIKEWLKPGQPPSPDADHIPNVSAEGRQRLQEATTGFAVIPTRHFTVRADKRLPKEVRERIALAAEAAREVMSQYLPVGHVGRLFILVFRSRSDLEKLAGERLPPEFDPVIMSFQSGLLLGVVSPVPEEYLAQVDYGILQEYLDHVLRQRGKVPEWLAMGLRLYLFGDRLYWPGSLQTCLKAVQGKDLNKFPSLRALESFDRSLAAFDPSQREEAQVPPIFAVASLVEEHGDEALKKFIVALWNEKETEEALKEAFGINYAELDRRWRQYAAQVSQRGKVGD